MEEIEKQKQEALENVKKTATEAATTVVDAKIEEIVKKFENVTSKESTDEMKAEFTKSLQELQAKVKEIKQTGGNKAEKSFNEHLAEAIEKNAEAIQGFKKGSPEVSIVMKDVGDMSIVGNFTNPTPFIQEVNTNLITSPYNRVWLADLLPQATSKSNSVLYPKENGGEGGAAHWNGSGNKAQMDFDLTSQSAFFKWLAGVVVVEREMLDDIPWLTSYLQKKMLLSLKTKENDFVLNGTAALDTNRVAGILESATAYDGDFTNFGEMIIDAAYGQIPTGTNDFYMPTNVVLNPRDTVAIGLNKAAGSGEYDLPMNTVAFANGQLSIAGLQTVGTTQMTKNNFLAFDKNATMFVRRMSPEIRLFEDATLAKTNKVMFRIEERVTLAIFNNLGLVKGTYVPAGESEE